MPAVGSGAHDPLGLVQVHRQGDVAFAQGSGESIAFGRGVAAVEQDLRARGQRVDDVQAGRDAVADSGAHRESRGDLGDWLAADGRGVRGDMAFVSEEVLGGRRCVPVRCPHRASRSKE
jgi:hypothetical protein